MSERGMPKFNVRRSQKLQNKLGRYAIVRGFSYVPVYNSINNIWVDNLNLDGCKYPIDMESYMRTLPDTYGKVSWLVDNLRNLYKKEFELNDTDAKNITMKKAFGYSDYLISERFNFGNCTHIKPTQDQINMINTTQMYWMINPYTNESRNILNSHYIDHPLKQMKKIMEKKNPENRYVLYSGHDVSVALLVQSMAPAFNFTWVPYASSLITEVFEPEGSPENLHVRMSMNGNPVPLGHEGLSYQMPLEVYMKDMGTRLIIDNDRKIWDQCHRKVDKANPFGKKSTATSFGKSFFND
jgi:hypothetical protein